MTTQSGASNGAYARSALLAGLTAGFLWMAITTLVGDFGSAAVVGGGVAFLIVAALITAGISGAVRQSRKHQRPQD